MKNYKVAIVGATGLVGRTFLKVLKERNFLVEEYRLNMLQNLRQKVQLL